MNSRHHFAELAVKGFLVPERQFPTTLSADAFSKMDAWQNGALFSLMSATRFSSPTARRFSPRSRVDRHPTLEQWQALERRTKRSSTRACRAARSIAASGGYFTRYLLRATWRGHGGSVDALVENTQNSANWDQILPGTRDALDRISQKFRIAVISNSDGRIDRVLSRCGIADCFESITDSGTVGVEKPRREIFEAALAKHEGSAPRKACMWAMYIPWTTRERAMPGWMRFCSMWPALTATAKCRAWNRWSNWKAGFGDNQDRKFLIMFVFTRTCGLFLTTCAFTCYCSWGRECCMCSPEVWREANAKVCSRRWAPFSAGAVFAAAWEFPLSLRGRQWPSRP